MEGIRMRRWIYKDIEGGKRKQFALAVSGVPWIRKPAILVNHTTEGKTLPGYRGGLDAPHFTVDLRNRRTWQHFSLRAGARSLRPGGVYANNRGTVQLEIIGSASKMHLLPPDELDYLAHVWAVIMAETGIPPRVGKGVTFRGLDDSYGTDSRTRMTAKEFAAYRGVAGHQHIPGNSHWDPGRLRAGKVIERVLAILNPPKPEPPSVPVVEPEPDVDPHKAPWWLVDTTTRTGHGPHVEPGPEPTPDTPASNRWTLGTLLARLWALLKGNTHE